MNDSVVDFSDFAAKLAAKANEDQEYFEHMDRLMVGTGVLFDAVRRLREAQLTDGEIVGLLRHAASVCAGDD